MVIKEGKKWIIKTEGQQENIPFSSMSFILWRFMILMATFLPVREWVADFTLLKAPNPIVLPSL
jgi:hypothetical protein